MHDSGPQLRDCELGSHTVQTQQPDCRHARPLVSAYKAPLKVQLEVTRRCNLRCVHCYNDSGRGIPNECSPLDWREVARQCADLDVCHVAITGGEPFIRPEVVFEVLDVCEASGMGASVTTNGTLLDEQLVGRLADYGCLFKVQVSLDGSRPPTHDILRGAKGAWRAAIRGISLLRRLPIHIAVACVLSKINHKEVADLIRVCRLLGVDRVSFTHLMKLGRALSPALELDAGCEEYQTIIDQLRAAHDSKGLKILMAYHQRRNWQTDFNGPNSSFLVRADMQVVPRCYLDRPAFSARDSTLAEIWHRGLMHAHQNKELLRRVRASDPPNEVLHRCEVQTWNE